MNENQTTQLICNVFDTDDHLACLLMTRALLAGVPGTQTINEPLWIYQWRKSPGPDLVLVDDRDAVRVVIEHKRKAQAQASSMAAFSRGRRFTDVRSQQFTLGGDPAPHTWRQANECCGWSPHQSKRRSDPAGQYRAGVWQIDLYRYSSVWLNDAVTLDNPEDVHWVLLDEEDRSASEVFEGADSADLWHTTGYPAFIAAVSAARASLSGEATPNTDTLAAIDALLAEIDAP